MTGPGGHDDPASPMPPGGQPPEPPAWQPPWEAPALDYPPDSPPGYPPGYSSGYPPPGYQQPSDYGGPAYPPMPAPYGAPPGGYGYYPGPDYLGSYGALQSGTNTMAIVSLVSSLVGVLCCVGSIVGIVLGIIALNEIKRTRQDGYGLAVAGIVVGVATLIVYLVLIMFSAR